MVCFYPVVWMGPNQRIVQVRHISTGACWAEAPIEGRWRSPDIDLRRDLGSTENSVNCRGRTPTDTGDPSIAGGHDLSTRPERLRRPPPHVPGVPGSPGAARPLRLPLRATRSRACARWDPGTRGCGSAVVPRRHPRGGRRIPGRLGVLHPVRLPDHLAPAAPVGGAFRGRAAHLLVETVPTAATGVVADDGAGAGHRRRRPVGHRTAAFPAWRRALVSRRARQLALHRVGHHVRRLVHPTLAARALLEPGDRAAVLRRVAGDHRRVAGSRTPAQCPTSTRDPRRCVGGTHDRVCRRERGARSGLDRPRLLRHRHPRRRTAHRSVARLCDPAASADPHRHGPPTRRRSWSPGTGRTDLAVPRRRAGLDMAVPVGTAADRVLHRRADPRRDPERAPGPSAGGDPAAGDRQDQLRRLPAALADLPGDDSRPDRLVTLAAPGPATGGHVRWRDRDVPPRRDTDPHRTPGGDPRGALRSSRRRSRPDRRITTGHPEPGSGAELPEPARRRRDRHPRRDHHHR